MTTQDHETVERPTSRPTMDELHERRSLRERLTASGRSIRQALALAGVLTLALGILLWVFARDLETSAYIVMGIGAFVLVVDAVISFATVRQTVLGRRGRYGLNTAIVFIAFVAIAIALNYLLIWAANRTDPPGWLRVDTTATRQFIVSDASLNTLRNLREPIRVTAFFRRNTPQGQAAWRNTEDLLAEFRRRSSVQDLTYRVIDPDIEPNVATEYGVTRFPSLAVEAVESRRTQTIIGGNPNDGPTVFYEQDLITGLLVVNQLKQKQVMFVSGHAGRDVTDLDRTGDGYGTAADALRRENYEIRNATVQELGQLLSTGNPDDVPAVVVFPGPTNEMEAAEETVLLRYARQGGSFMLMLDPDAAPDSFKAFLSRFAVAVGEGRVVDTASFVAPNPAFLQIKNSNSQFPPSEITDGFDVVYLPGTAHFAYSIDAETIPITEDGVPYVRQLPVAVSTLNSWAETDPEGLDFNRDEEIPGPLPVVVSVQAIAEIAGAPVRDDDGFVETNMVLVGDTDFASNQYFGSARNGDLFVNAINWLADDYELITLRPKEVAFRELVLTEPERNFVRWSGWLLMPALVALAGIWAWWRRR